MKVLMINSVCGIRSTGRICTDLADVLIANGHECKIAFGRESVPEKYRDIAVRIGSDFDVKLHGLKSRLFDMHGFGSKKATQKFIKWVKEYDPDVIHLHNIHGYYINIEVLFDYLKTCEKKIIWTLHDCWAFTGHCSNLIGCDKWKTECFDCEKYRNYPSSMIDQSRKNFEKKKNLFSNIQNMIIVTPSKWLCNLVRQSFLCNSRTDVIHNGIDLDVFKPVNGRFCTEMGIENKKIVLGVASAWGKNKGIEDFKKLPVLLGEDYKVVLVGLTDEQKGNLPEEILGITRTNDTKQLAEIYTSSFIFANLTYNDNYPTVNLEAQACGTPAITYRTGGSVESVTEGMVVEQGDLNGLVEKIKTLAVKGIDRNCYINRAEMFDKKRMCKQYLDIYSE